MNFFIWVRSRWEIAPLRRNDAMTHQVAVCLELDDGSIGTCDNKWGRKWNVASTTFFLVSVCIPLPCLSFECSTPNNFFSLLVLWWHHRYTSWSSLYPGFLSVFVIVSRRREVISSITWYEWVYLGQEMRLEASMKRIDGAILWKTIRKRIPTRSQSVRGIANVFLTRS